MEKVSMVLRRKIEIGILCMSLGLQCYYIIKKYPTIKQYIYTQNERIVADESKLQELDEGLKQLPKMKMQLDIVSAKGAAIQNTIPKDTTAISQIHLLKKYMDLNAFYNPKITDEGREVCEEEVGHIVKQYYTLEFTSFYDEAKSFVAHLNSAREMITIQDLTITNQIQEVESEEVIRALKIHFGDNLSEVVTTKLSLIMYTQEDSKGQEVAPISDVNSFICNETPFENTNGSRINSLGYLTGTSIEESKKTSERAQDIFEITLADLLTSGETYKLSGPGAEQTSVGIISKENIYMTLKIDKQGYVLIVEDEKGNIKQDSYTMEVKAPNLYIESTMQQIQEVMPQIYVYIYNDLEEVLEVKLNGSLLENVHIYNKFEEEVLRGEAKGSVKVT